MSGSSGNGSLAEAQVQLANYPPEQGVALHAKLTQSAYKEPCRVASAATIANLSSVSASDFDGTAQGVTLDAGNRVLVKNNASPDGVISAAAKYQGVYVARAISGDAAHFNLVRDLDADADPKLASGASVWVSEGTYADQEFTLTTANPIVLGTTALTWAAPVAAPAATSSALGTVQLAGDLAGAGSSAAAPKVGSVGGIALFAIAPVLAVAVANVASLSGPQTVDGVSLVAGNRVYLAKQSTPAQNGIWVVQAGAWTRPSDWAAGTTPPLGTRIRVAPGGTSNAAKYGGEWFVTSVSGGAIDTGTVIAYPVTVRGQTALVSGTPSAFTVSNAWVLSATQSVPSIVNMTNVADTAMKAVLAADSAPGAGDGTLTVTGPNTLTDTVGWMIRNA